jgi:hypothetical protein
MTWARVGRRGLAKPDFDGGIAGQSPLILGKEAKAMDLSELPHLRHALSILSLDIGATLKTDAAIPVEWWQRAGFAEFELSKLNAQQVEDFVIGELGEQEPYKLAAPNADALFEDAFDGDLSDIFYKGIKSALDYICIEDTAAAFTHWKKEQA